jgi:hypothetical protein
VGKKAGQWHDHERGEGGCGLSFVIKATMK